MKIVDRIREQQKLRKLATAGHPRLAVMYGRRRIGKTYLLTHVWDEESAFYFTASSVTPEQNRRQLIRRISEWTEQPHQPEDFPTWRTVFRLLFSMTTERPLVIVLDEFQYLGSDPEGLAGVTSELNAVWEGPDRPEGSLLLVLCGSAVRTMETLTGGGAPLYGRLAWRAHLEPFDYFDAASMVPFDGLRDRAYAYGIFGGTPQYLASVDAERPLSENVAELMLAPSGMVRTQVESAVWQERGLRDTPKYVGILSAIGAGRTELSEIADRVGMPKHTAVRDKIHRLVDLGWVRRERNFDAGRTIPWRYRLADPAFRFYHEFVPRYETALQTAPAAGVWEAHVVDGLDAYMGHLFERIVEQAYHRLRRARDLELIDEWGRWEGTDRQGRSLEIDIVSRLTTGAMLTGAIKWNRQPVGAQLHRDHVRDLVRLGEAGHRWAHRALEEGSRLLYVAAGGFGDGFRARAQEEGLPVETWSLHDLYHSG